MTRSERRCADTAFAEPHTRGPWTVHPERLVTTKCHPIHAAENDIDAGPVAFATAQNAALIAAAPAMFRLLRDALMEIHNPGYCQHAGQDICADIGALFDQIEGR